MAKRKAKHLADSIDDDVAIDDERAPLPVVLGTVAGTLALAGMLGVVSLGTMNGMKNNAVENVRAQVMAGQASDVDENIETDVDADADGKQDGAQVGHLGDGGGSAVDANGDPIPEQRGSSGTEDATSSVNVSEGNGSGATGDNSASGNGTGNGSHSGANGQVYEVQWGDTLSDISRRFGVSVDDIATHNGIWDPNVIYADSSLQIPNKH